MRMICSLLLALSLSLFAEAQCPKGFTEKYSTTLSGGGTAFNYEPAMNVWACIEDQPGITGQQIFWRVKTFFHHYSVIKFVKHIKLTCGNVIVRNVRLYDLKDGQTIGGATFSGDGDLIDAVFKEDCANKNRIESVWISDVTCELADDDYMVVQEKDRLARIKADEEARKGAERKRIAEERAAKEKAAAREKEAKEKAIAEAKAKAKSNGSSSGGSNYSYTPVALTPAQQYSSWLNQYSANLIKEQQIANDQYQKAQNIAEQSFANGVSTKQGLQNYQSNMGELAQSQDMSTSAGRTRATVYAAESVAAGIASIFIKEHDYEAEEQRREENRKYEREARAKSEIDKRKANDEIQQYIDADLVWLYVNVESPEDKLFQFNVINTRYLRKKEVSQANYYNNINVGYGNKTTIDFRTGMPVKVWEIYNPLQPELSSAFEGVVNKNLINPKTKWNRKKRRRTLKGKYGEFDKYALRGMNSLFLNNGKDSAKALAYLEKAAVVKPDNVFIKDAIGEIYYDKAVRNNDPQLMRKAFGLFSESMKNEVLSSSQIGLYQRLYHNQLLAAYRLVMDERTEKPEQYLNISADQFKKLYKPELNSAAFNLDKQAARFYNDKNYDAVLKLHKVLIDSIYNTPENIVINSWLRVGNCYANGWAGDKDTAEAIKCFSKAKGTALEAQAQDQILKLRDPAAYADKYALNHLYYTGIHANVAKLLDDIKEDAKINMIRLANSDGGFLIHTEKGDVYSKNVKDTLLGAIRRAMSSGERIKHIFLSPDGKAWSVIYGKNYYNTEGLPQGLLQSMSGYYKNGQIISHLAVGPNESWVLVEGSNGYSYDKIPDALVQGLKMVNSQKGTIDLITFHPKKGWLMIYNGNEYLQEDISQQVLQKLNEYKQKNRTIHSVSFSESGYLIN